MGRMYSATFEKVAVTLAQDLFQIVGAADNVTVLHAIYISQDSDTDNEYLNILMHMGTTNGSGGSTVTPTPLSLGDSAYGGTVEANNTTQSTEGTFIPGEDWGVLTPFIYMPTPKMQLEISPSDIFIVELQDAPADELTVSGTIYFEALGG